MKARVVLYPRALMAAAAPQEQAKPLPPLPDTALLYWEDTWHLRDEATVLRAWRAEGEEGRWCVALDRTIFHPQGGGQPADVGEMRVGARVFAVDAVRREGAVVVHQGRFVGDAEPFAAGERAALLVDGDRRRLHARLHSAGHLLDLAMARAGFSFPSTKGFHFPEGAFVEYRGAIDAAAREAAVAAIQRELDALVAAALPVRARVVDYAALSEACGGDVPDYLPKDKPARVVRVGDLAGCPCGGTHVTSTAEVGRVEVQGIKKTGELLRVRYKIL